MAKASAEINVRDLLIKARFYRIVSLIFVMLGLFIFMIMYIGNIEGRLLEALKNPFTISVFIIPFLPAAVLSWLADKHEKKYLKLTEKK